MIRRKAEPTLEQLKRGFPVVAITGPRQSGKTTLARSFFRDYEYLSLEEIDIRREAVEDPRGFLDRRKGGFVLDEVQHAPELFSFLQGTVDREKEMGRVVLTGSQNFQMMERITQSLAGRVGLVELLPFSWSELGVAESRKSLDAVLFEGGYPPVHDRKLAPDLWYPRYIQTYVDRDVRSLRQVGDLLTFQKFIRLCAGRIGQLINFSSLANECGIDAKTAQAWLSVLETSYILFRLTPHHRNFNKRLVKQPKLYFTDTGLACSLLGIESADQIETHYLRGGRSRGRQTACHRDQIRCDDQRFIFQEFGVVRRNRWRRNGRRAGRLRRKSSLRKKGPERRSVVDALTSTANSKKTFYPSS